MTTEPSAPKSRSCKLARLSRILIWMHPYRNGLHQELGNNGSLQGFTGYDRSWVSTRSDNSRPIGREFGFLTDIGCTYLITCWYKRYEVGKRLSAFWIMSCLTTGFAAIFAYALSLMKGIAGLNGWSCTRLGTQLLGSSLT